MKNLKLNYDGCGINASGLPQVLAGSLRIFTAARHHKDNGGGFVLEDAERRRIGELMAAAPEMLALLRQGLTPKHPADNRGPCLCSGCEWNRAAMALIARAEGRA